MILEVPGTPPSVNSYVRHTRSGRHYVTKEAKAFKEAVALLARGQRVEAKAYALEVWIYLGSGQRGDGDNFWKLIADALVSCGAIHSDAAVEDWILHRRRDPKRPRTVILVSEKRAQGHKEQAQPCRSGAEEPGFVR